MKGEGEGGEKKVSEAEEAWEVCLEWREIAGAFERCEG